MTENLHIQNQDLPAYAGYQRDGVLDLLVGLGTILFAVGMLTDTFYLVAIFPALMIPVWQAARKSTLSRLQEAEFSPGNSGSSRIILMGTLLAGVLFLVLGVYVAFSRNAGQIPDWVRQNFSLLISSFFVLLFVIMAFVLRVWRFMAYAAVLAILTLLGYFASFEFPALVLSFGILVTLGGVVTLVAFLNQHPKPA